MQDVDVTMKNRSIFHDFFKKSKKKMSKREETQVRQIVTTLSNKVKVLSTNEKALRRAKEFLNAFKISLLLYPFSSSERIFRNSAVKSSFDAADFSGFEYEVEFSLLPATSV